MLSSRDPESADQWEYVKGFGYTNQPPLLQDDQILLVLRYPKTLTLTNRAIRGSMKSLNPKSNIKYFDEVHISSGLGASAKYEFSSDKIVSKVCHSYPYEDRLMKGGFHIYKGLDFCLILERFTQGEAMIVLPSWQCNEADNFCSKLGPFGSDKEIKATNGSFKDVKLVLQDVQCEKELSRDNGDFLKVSAVFRAVSPCEKQFRAAQRTGLNNMTLSADGVWNSSSGQLCMVGCLGMVDVQGNGCNSRICLYLPLLFSIKQRSIIMGTISSIDKSARSYFPLSFEKLVRPAEMWDQYTSANPYYSYSKSDSAIAVLEKNKPFNFGSVIKKSLLKFPKLEDTQAFLVSLSLLSEDLTLHISAFPDPIPKSRPSRTDVQMEIVSLGPLFGRYWSSGNSSILEEETPYHSKAEYTEKQLLLNVSVNSPLLEQHPTTISRCFSWRVFMI
ncbi:Alanine racemase, partial [Actinidia chinensis var. chinensis]